MSVSTLQQSAFQLSPEFANQVSVIVRREAEYKAGLLNPEDPATAQLRQTYAQVVRDPGRYGFVPALVAAVTWAITYDVWAADPDAVDGEVLGGVQALWTLLVGT